MNIRKKIRYIWDYYRWTFFLLAAAGLLLFYIGDMVYKSSQTIDLQGFFINDSQNHFPAGRISEDFSEYAKTAPGHRIAFDDSLLIDLDSGRHYHTSSQSKLMAYIAAKELDFLVAPESLARFYARSFPLLDFNQLLPADLKDRLREDLIFGTDDTGKQKAWGLDLRHSRFLEEPGNPPGEPYYLLILSYTPHSGTLISFLHYSYQEPLPD